MSIMKKIYFLIIVFGAAFADPVTEELLQRAKIVNYGYNKFAPSPYSKKIVAVPFDSPEGITIFERSKHKKAFFKLAPHYSPQQTITTCGISSGVIILNTIYANEGKTPPISLSGSYFDEANNTIEGEFIWTEENFLAAVEGNYVLGVALNQLSDILKLQGLKVTAHSAASSNKEDIERFRRQVKTLMENPVSYMIANYSLTLYLKDGGGHFSPVAAYEEASDSVLILDTWAGTNSWVWVKLEDFYKSMNTIADDTFRGYLLITCNQ